jgi:hypothetical protein
VKKSSVYKQEPVILRVVPLNVMNVSFFDLQVLPVSMNFSNIKRSLILFDVLTWTLFGLVRPELSENSEECGSTQTLNLVKPSDLLCFLTRLGLFPLIVSLIMMGDARCYWHFTPYKFGWQT